MKEIRINNIEKKYNKTKVLKDISFKIYENDRLAIIGHNGAGKSTLLGIILNLIKPTKGNIEFNFNPSFEAILSKPLYLDYLSATDNIKISLLTCRTKLINIEKWLNEFGLANLGGQKVKNFSSGMKQRLSLALSLLREVEIFVFDEPINGLDKEANDLYLTNIRRIIDKNKVLLFAGHDFKLYEMVANKILLLKEGKIIYYGTIQEVISKYKNIENLYLLKNENL